MLFTGILCALAAQLIWGLSPVYFKQIAAISPYEVLSHRIIWSFLMLALMVWLLKRWSHVFALLTCRKHFICLLTTGFLLATMWFIFGWAVINNHVVDASLGYIISPLLNVASGHFLLKEKLSYFQKIAIGLAFVGVCTQVIITGVFPWVSLLLATCFSAYALLKKKHPLPSIESLLIETTLLLLPALGLLLALILNNTCTFDLCEQPTLSGLLMFSGLITCVPFVFYAIAVRHITLGSLGMLQFIAPLMMFLLGVVFYHEPINQRIISILLIITAQFVYLLSLLQQSRQATHL